MEQNWASRNKYLQPTDLDKGVQIIQWGGRIPPTNGQMLKKKTKKFVSQPYIMYKNYLNIDHQPKYKN